MARRRSQPGEHQDFQRHSGVCLLRRREQAAESLLLRAEREGSFRGIPGKWWQVDFEADSKVLRAEDDGFGVRSYAAFVQPGMLR